MGQEAKPETPGDKPEHMFTGIIYDAYYSFTYIPLLWLRNVESSSRFQYISEHCEDMYCALCSHVATCCYSNVLLADDNVIVRLCIVLCVHTLLLVAMAMLYYLTITGL